MKPCKPIEDIKRHQLVYAEMNLDVPAYRITRKEMKEIYLWLKSLDMLPKGQEFFYDEMAYFHDVELQVVTIG